MQPPEGYAQRGTQTVLAGLTAALWDLDVAKVEDGRTGGSGKESGESGEKNLGGWGVKSRTLKLWVVATQIIFSFSPSPGEMIHFEEHTSQLGGSTTN